jgi:N-acetylglutamate synthase-like GNAT family acetyltransferase
MNYEVEIRLISPGSDDYRSELELRNKILRIPLGLDVYKDDLTKEHLDKHLGAFITGRLVGVLVLTKLSNEDVKMRQVAVENDLQGKGIGRKLVEYSEQLARELGYSRIVMNARLEAVPFYEKLGYDKISGMFIEVTIPHYKLSKQI